jgi:hypothetical protein
MRRVAWKLPGPEKYSWQRGRCPPEAEKIQLAAGSVPQKPRKYSWHRGRCPQKPRKYSWQRGRCPTEAETYSWQRGRCPTEAEKIQLAPGTVSQKPRKYSWQRGRCPRTRENTVGTGVGAQNQIRCVLPIFTLICVPVCECSRCVLCLCFTILYVLKAHSFECRQFWGNSTLILCVGQPFYPPFHPYFGQRFRHVFFCCFYPYFVCVGQVFRLVFTCIL